MRTKTTALVGAMLISMNSWAIATPPFNPHAGTGQIGNTSPSTPSTGTNTTPTTPNNPNTGATAGTTPIGGGGSVQNGDTSTHIPTDGQACEVAQSNQEQFEDRVMEVTVQAEALNPDTFFAKLKEHPSTKQCMAGFREILDISIFMPQTGSITQGAIKTAVISAVKKMLQEKRKQYEERLCTVAQSALKNSLGGLYGTLEAVQRNKGLFNNPDQVIAGLVVNKLDQQFNRLDSKLQRQIGRLEGELNQASQKVAQSTDLSDESIVQNALNEMDKIQDMASNSSVTVNTNQNVSDREYKISDIVNNAQRLANQAREQGERQERQAQATSGTQAGATPSPSPSQGQGGQVNNNPPKVTPTPTPSAPTPSGATGGSSLGTPAQSGVAGTQAIR